MVPTIHHETPALDPEARDWYTQCRRDSRLRQLMRSHDIRNPALANYVLSLEERIEALEHALGRIGVSS